MKEIYLSAIQSVIEGKLTKEELWEVIDEHLSLKDQIKQELLTDSIVRIFEKKGWKATKIDGIKTDY